MGRLQPAVRLLTAAHSPGALPVSLLPHVGWWGSGGGAPSLHLRSPSLASLLPPLSLLPAPSRLSPVPAFVNNYLLAAAGTPPRTYLPATAAGIVPAVANGVLLGAALGEAAAAAGGAGGAGRGGWLPAGPLRWALVGLSVGGGAVVTAGVVRQWRAGRAHAEVAGGEDVEEGEDQR